MSQPFFLNSTDNVDIKEIGKLKIGLISYPRCGNSLLRTILENITGVVTGSDSRPDRNLIRQLTKMGFRGEGIVDEKVLFVKTHFPERLGSKEFKIDAAILLARNPFDAITSYFNMLLTQTHTHTIANSEYERLKHVWLEFVCEECVVYDRFYEYWLSILKSQEIPILKVRYEDLVAKRGSTIRNIIEFVCDVLKNYNIDSKVIQSLNTRMETNLEVVLSLSQDQQNRYSPRSQKKNIADVFFKCISKFSTPERVILTTTTRPVLYFFGYWQQLAALGIVPAMNSFEQYEVNKSILVTINKKLRIRPTTSFDPYGRGFGTRWKKILSELSPIAIIDNPPFDFSLVPG